MSKKDILKKVANIGTLNPSSLTKPHLIFKRYYLIIIIIIIIQIIIKIIVITTSN